MVRILQHIESKANEVLQGYADLFRDDILISYSLAYYFYKMKATIDDMAMTELKLKKGENFIKILDVGCNRGHDIFRMKRRFSNHNISFFGIDISPLDIEYANKVVVKNGIKNCRFIVGDAEHTNFDDGSFDIVICSEVLEHIPQPERVLREIHRILKNQGIAIITTPNAENKVSKLKKLAPKWLKKGWNKPPNEPSAEEVNMKAKKGFINLPHISEKGIGEWIQISEKFGFSIEDVRRGSLMWGHEFFDDHPGLTGMVILFDSILDKITYDFSPNFAMKMRK